MVVFWGVLAVAQVQVFKAKGERVAEGVRA